MDGVYSSNQNELLHKVFFFLNKRVWWKSSVWEHIFKLKYR